MKLRRTFNSGLSTFKVYYFYFQRELFFLITKHVCGDVQCICIQIIWQTRLIAVKFYSRNLGENTSHYAWLSANCTILSYQRFIWVIMKSIHYTHHLVVICESSRQHCGLSNLFFHSVLAHFPYLSTFCLSYGSYVQK